MSKENLNEGGNNKVGLLPSDFFVDFLGGLVPGILFSISTATALVPPLYYFFKKPQEIGETPLIQYLMNALAATQGTPNTLWFAAFGIIVGFCYVLGHLFYRQDIKKPNRRSFRKNLKKLKKARQKKERDQTYDPARDSFEPEKELACSTENKCEFPFPNYDQYLKQRGLDHLLPLVVWREETLHRSKTYINLLKIRLRHHYPHKCSAIIRNEGHIRLASSIWYVSRVLRTVAFSGFFLVLLPVVLLLFYGLSPAPEELQELFGKLGPPILAPLLVLILSEYSRSRVESFLHYQRLREVFYVLETAYTAFRGNEGVLNPPFDFGLTDRDSSMEDE